MTVFAVLAVKQHGTIKLAPVYSPRELWLSYQRENIVQFFVT